jgi:hypothetical protein
MESIKKVKEAHAAPHPLHLQEKNVCNNKVPKVLSKKE